MVAGTIALVDYFNNSTKIELAKLNSSTKIELAKLQAPDGDGKFYIQSHTGDYCTAEIGEDCRLTSNRKIVQNWEHFEILRANDQRIALRASNGKFVAADRNIGGLLVANRDQMSDWELFTIEDYGPFLALKSSDGKYVSRREDENTCLRASAPEVREWELFRIMKQA